MYKNNSCNRFDFYLFILKVEQILYNFTISVSRPTACQHTFLLAEQKHYFNFDFISLPVKGKKGGGEGIQD